MTQPTPMMFDALSQIGKALTNASLYGSMHRLTQQAVSSGYGVVRSVLEQTRRIDLALVEGELYVNDSPMGARNPLAMTLVSRLMALNISAFSLVAGMSQQEFRDLIDLLMSLPPASGESTFAESVRRRHLQHVKTGLGDYRRVAESEVVVDVDELAARSGPGDGGRSVFDLDGAFDREAGSEFGSHNAPAREATSPETILAFLKGEAGTSAEAATEGLADMLSDADRLGNLILEAAVVRQRNSAFAAGESLADLVVGCLRRTYEGLNRRPEAATPEGQRDLKRSLILLEKNVLDRLHAMVEGLDGDEGGLPWQDELSPDSEATVEALATEYVRRRDALQQAENRIVGELQALSGQGSAPTDLCRRLTQLGLPSDGWRELVAKAGTGGAGGDVPGASGALGALAALLTQLDSVMSSEGKGAAGPLAVLIGDEVDAIAQSTEAKISALARRTRPSADDGATCSAGHALDRQLLAEITQELCQPATVIACAVATILGGLLGPVNSGQRELLDLASGCGDRLAGLLDKLRDAVGVPQSLDPSG